MQRREILTLIGGALGLAASGPALAAPVTGIDQRDERDVPARVNHIRAQLAAIRARRVPAEMQGYLASKGLAADTIPQLMATFAATAAFRELDVHAQAHPEAQALLAEEAPRAGLIGGRLSHFLKNEHPLSGIDATLRERPEIGLDLRVKLAEAAEAFGIPANWVEALDHHVEAVHWRMRHQSSEAETAMAVGTVDERWRAAGLDPAEVRSAATGQAMGLAADGADGGGDDQDAEAARHGKRLERAGLIMMGVAGGVFLTAAIVLTAAGGTNGLATAVVFVGIPALIVILTGLIIFLVGKSSVPPEHGSAESETALPVPT